MPLSGLTVKREDVSTVTISGAPNYDVNYTAPAATKKHTVTLTGGGDHVTVNGDTQQKGFTGGEMQTVTYTTASGYYFAPFNNINRNGVTATRTNETTVTVSGTPHNDVNITVPTAVLIPVSGVSLDKTETQTTNVGEKVEFNATVDPNSVLDKTVKWSVTGDSVKLYSDEACTEGNEVGTDATSTLTVYAKGISAGDATVTVTSNANSTKSASCAVTVQNPALTHDEYNAAETSSEVIIESYVQAKQSWYNGKATIYLQSEDGAYFVYDMSISQADYDKLVPGTKVRITGTKSEWKGEVEITDASFVIQEGDTWTATPTDVTSLLASDDLIDHQNELVSVKGVTVEAYDESGAAFKYKNESEKTDDLYFKICKDGNIYEFCVEFGSIPNFV